MAYECLIAGLNLSTILQWPFHLIRGESHEYQSNKRFLTNFQIIMRSLARRES